jgi:hypothetical protein
MALIKNAKIVNTGRELPSESGQAIVIDDDDMLAEEIVRRAVVHPDNTDGERPTNAPFPGAMEFACWQDRR